MMTASMFENLQDMIPARIDTIATFVERTMAELIKNPRFQRKLNEELYHVIGYSSLMIGLLKSSLPYKCG